MYKKSLFVVLLFVFIAAPVTGSVRSGLEEHKRLADEAWGHVARGDNVSAGKGIENVVAVARMYRDLENDADAREYFRRAMVIAPLRVDVRFDYAQVCAKTGDAEAAKGAYRIVLAQAENDRMLAESAAFLGVEAFKELPAFSTAENRVGEKGIRLCLVTVPGGQRWLAHDVGARLGRLLVCGGARFCAAAT